MYHTKTIAVFISHLFGRYQTELCQGIIDKNTEYGYRTEIFTSMDGEDVGKYGLGEDSILEIPDPSQFAGVIFASGTYLTDSLCKKIGALLQTFSCPVLEITNTASNFPSLALDNNSAFGMLTAHLADKHHHKKIWYMGSLDHTFFSNLREEACQTAANARPEVTFFTFAAHEDPSSIHDTFEQTLLKQGTLPESIICYNDSMALSILSILLEKGFHIPEDIVVCGCDNLPICSQINDTLTTIDFPIHPLGQKASELICGTILGQPLPPYTVFQAEPIYRCSCGCQKKDHDSSFFLAIKQQKQIDQLEHSLIRDIRMSSVLHGISTLDDGMNALRAFVSELPQCQEFYICLYSGWDSASSEILQLTADESRHDPKSEIVELAFAYRDGKFLSPCTFVHHSPLPLHFYTASDCSYIYQPLYFEDAVFGYAAIAYEQNRLVYPFSFISWIRNVNSMLQNIRQSAHMGLLVSRLEELYLHDEMTGLFNQNGLRIHRKELLEKAARDHLSVLAIAIDLNQLKNINDTFGREEGDFALRVVGHALENAASENDICARTGDDEFCILGIGHTNLSALRIMETIESYLANYNKLYTKKYVITVNQGFAINKPDQPFNLTKLLAAAYDNLLENKG